VFQRKIIDAKVNSVGVSRDGDVDPVVDDEEDSTHRGHLA
jgi:hypothetical protein